MADEPDKEEKTEDATPRRREESREKGQVALSHEVASALMLLVALLARMVPQLNVMDVSYSARIAVGLIALLVFAPFLAPALEGLYDQFARGLDGALDVLGT